MALRLNQNEPTKPDSTGQLDNNHASIGSGVTGGDRERREPQETPIETRRAAGAKNDDEISEEVRRARQKLYDDFVSDMIDASMDNVSSEEQIMMARKRYKALQNRKRAMVISFVATMICLCVFGFYNTFLKHELTYQEIAYIANAYNGQTNFPNDGVYGYITGNAKALITPKITVESDIESVDVKDPVVTKIVQKSNTYANVYFYVTLATSKGEQRMDYMVPLYWDKDVWTYQLAGQVIATPSMPVDKNTKDVGSNPYLDYGAEVGKYSEEQSAKAKAYVDNFFDMLYSGKDVSPYYSGEKLNAEKVDYVAMDSFTMFTEKNANGYNTLCEIRLKTDNGIYYSTRKYLNVIPDGDGWKITNVM